MDFPLNFVTLGPNSDERKVEGVGIEAVSAGSWWDGEDAFWYLKPLEEPESLGTGLTAPFTVLPGYSANGDKRDNDQKSQEVVEAPKKHDCEPVADEPEFMWAQIPNNHDVDSEWFKTRRFRKVKGP